MAPLPSISLFEHFSFFYLHAENVPTLRIEDFSPVLRLSLGSAYKCILICKTVMFFYIVSLALIVCFFYSAISVELYYIFATVWGREQYTLYGILFIVFAILLSVGACISVALTYFQLSGEDYRWWWRSILSTGSTGAFIFLYSVFYYWRRSNMSGVVQSVEFFGYSFLTAYVFFLMLGTVSFTASLRFIRYIYVNLKMD